MGVEVEVGGIYEQAADLTPAGTIVAYGGTTAPGGWLLCDGTAINRITYSSLFDVIGTNFGEGDGSTTFNLPDFRGMFLRGADNGKGRDIDSASITELVAGGNSGDNVGSYQGDAIRNIVGKFEIRKSESGANVVYSATGPFSITTGGDGGSSIDHNSADQSRTKINITA